jgi:PIN domain nuclease of toxin-antitoxin system
MPSCGTYLMTATARSSISDPNNEVSISAASYWEIAIKISVGKYKLSEPVDAFFERQILVNDFRVVPILPRHAQLVSVLPFHHRDPFDRLVVAQAQAEQLTVCSSDHRLDAYGITRLW